MTPEERELAIAAARIAASAALPRKKGAGSTLVRWRDIDALKAAIDQWAETQYGRAHDFWKLFRVIVEEETGNKP